MQTSPSGRRSRPHRTAFLAFAATLALSGCRVDIIRSREGNPLDTESFARLEVGGTTRAAAVERLGAPDQVEWKNGKDYIWYLYEDTVDTSLRFLFPPFRGLIGYQHNIARLNEGSDQVNAIELVFDEANVLEQKSIRISRAYKKPEESESPGAFHLTPWVDQSVYILGDGGETNYRDMFRNGFRAGLNLAYQPFPVLEVLGGGNFQEYQGDSFRDGAARVNMDDLQLYQFHIGIRLELPLSVFSQLEDFEEVKATLFSQEGIGRRGLCFFLEGTTGGTVTNNVPVKIDGIRRGNMYDATVVFSGGASVGLEYEWRRASVFIGVSYQGIEPLDEGSSPLDSRAGAFETFHVGGGLSLSF